MGCLVISVKDISKRLKVEAQKVCSVSKPVVDTKYIIDGIGRLLLDAEGKKLVYE